MNCSQSIGDIKALEEEASRREDADNDAVIAALMANSEEQSARGVGVAASAKATSAAGIYGDPCAIYNHCIASKERRRETTSFDS